MLEPLYPDRLAEDFLALTMPGHGRADYAALEWAAVTATGLLARDTDGQLPAHLARAVTFLAAAAQRWPHMRERL